MEVNLQTGVPSATELGKLITSLEAQLKESDEFWAAHGIDHEHGGFMCALSHSGDVLSDNKFIWYQGRGLWVYSRLYRLHGERPEHLEVARKTAAFISEHFAGRDGVYATATARDGKVAQAGDSASLVTTGYGTAFIAEGFIEYHKATGDAAALATSVAAFRTFVDLADGDRVSDETHIPLSYAGVRCLGQQMICLSLTRQLLEIDWAQLGLGSSEDLAWVTRLNDRAVTLIMDKFLHPEFLLLSEALAPDYSRPADDANEDFAYVGHGIEVAWMLMAEAKRREDTALYSRAADLFKRSVQVAKDPLFGGCFRGMNSVRKGLYMVDDDCKVKWVQDEVIVGCAMLMEQPALDGGDNKGVRDPSWAVRTLDEFLAYIRDKFCLKSRGLPYVMVGGDRTVTFRESYVNAGQPGALNRKENYHHPRALMLVLESLKRLSTTTA